VDIDLIRTFLRCAQALQIASMSPSKKKPTIATPVTPPESKLGLSAVNETNTCILII